MSHVMDEAHCYEGRRRKKVSYCRNNLGAEKFMKWKQDICRLLFIYFIAVCVLMPNIKQDLKEKYS